MTSESIRKEIDAKRELASDIESDLKCYLETGRWYESKRPNWIPKHLYGKDAVIFGYQHLLSYWRERYSNASDNLDFERRRNGYENS